MVPAHPPAQEPARRRELESPCLIVIGDVVTLADPALVPWVEDLPERETDAIDGHPAGDRDDRPAASPLACPA